MSATQIEVISTEPHIWRCLLCDAVGHEQSGLEARAVVLIHLREGHDIFSEREYHDHHPSDDEVLDAIDAWHTRENDGLKLHEYLGWAWRDYATWVEKNIVPGPLRKWA